jgi:hypothetical protein
MFIYNITVKVSNSIADQWMKWQREEHIPEIMSTNLFYQYKIFRLLDQADTDGPTFVIQYYTDERKSYNQYIKDHAPTIREKAFVKWGKGFIAFRSLLQAVQ